MYPGFVFGFTDKITRSKTMVCCAGDLINPTYLIALTLPVKPLSAFCLFARSDAKPGKALSPVVVIPPCRIEVVSLLCKNHRLIQIVTFMENITVVFTVVFYAL